MGRVSKLIAVILIIIVAGVFSYKPLLNALELGLDLQGGVQVTLQAKEKPGQVVSDDDMNQLKAVIRERVDQLGISEPRLQSAGENSLIA